MKTPNAFRPAVGERLEDRLAPSPPATHLSSLVARARAGRHRGSPSPQLPIDLAGTVQGTTHPLQTPSALGGSVRLTGEGRLRSLGAITGAGILNETSLRVPGSDQGTMSLTNALGAVVLHFDQMAN